ncbi:DUF2550 domain-containing protein [Gordonia neofelifaecis]|uniref:Secreted protein n=1 Tax=Gordonia neofelifaecis NRRL B-59395 TaxID=644548 RepID=F1YFD1_9ACTN|nr:DUF2550 domain-containing protein [Gordonia neofelifaecis]EGD56703.1 hypothetical protein SCNU_04092 [Gordonia neofelifaecis NRRL B-59395]
MGLALWVWIIIGVVVAGFFVAAGVVYRLVEVRRAGTPVLLRSLPADADEGWRHGSVQYGDDNLTYYRLSSLRPGPTVSMSRRRIEIVGRRRPVGTELEIMDDDFGIVELAIGRSGRGGRYELGMSPAVSTAFQSWIEARAPQRSRRRRPAA